MYSCGMYTVAFAALGILVLFCFLLDTLWSVLQFIRAILAPYFIVNEETSLTKKYGSWALITGSTDGIGKAYGAELAKRGLNIVLASRNPQRLEATAREFESKYNVKTKTISVDFSLGPKAIEIVVEEVGDLPIGILVNNVGKMYEYPMYLDEVPEKDLWAIININIGATTLLCRHFIVEMKKRGQGAIVNISSGSELQPLPLMTVYAASKAYIKSFTTALRHEYGNDNLTIQNMSPLFINTKMNHFSSKLQTPSTFVPNVEAFAKYAAATLGRMDETTGYWSHGIQYFCMKMVPVWVRTHIGASMNKSFREDYFRENRKTS